MTNKRTWRLLLLDLEMRVMIWLVRLVVWRKGGEIVYWAAQEEIDEFLRELDGEYAEEWMRNADLEP